jgi:hypothetical protein
MIIIQEVSAGGEGGIRTHDPVIHRIPLFESGAFSRSATSPALCPADTSDFIYMNYNLMSRFWFLFFWIVKQTPNLSD